MTSYPSPTYSFEESSDYYRVPIGRPTTPVDKIINSLETMPISPIKNNKGELTFTPTTWTTSMDLYKVRPKTSPRPSPTPSPVGTPPPVRSPTPTPSPYPSPSPRQRQQQHCQTNQRLLSHNDLNSVLILPEMEIYSENEPKDKLQKLETTITTKNNLQITNCFNPFVCLNFNPFAPFTNSPYPFSYSQQPKINANTKNAIVCPTLLPPPIFLSEENSTNKITNENFPFLFITGGSRTDNVVCTNPKCPCDAKPSYFVEKFFNY